MKRLTTIFLLLLFAFAFSNCKINGGSFQEHSVSINSKNSINITAYNEICPMICGAFYDFESNNTENYFSRGIFQFRHDDPVEIQTNNIKVVNENLAYFWMGWKFASTNDDGNT